jgi:5-methylcytosine-specific restriction endonuclease McrA
MKAIKLKRGDIREDGMIFWGYGKSYTNNEYWLPIDEFSKLSEKMKQSRKEAYLKNKGILKEKRQKRINANREKYTLIWKNEREKYKEKRETYFKEYYKNNKEKVYLANKKWREKNWGRMSGLLAKYRTKRKSQTPELSDASKMIVGVIFDQAKRLSKIIGIPFEVDHIIPISLGGIHSPINLQVIPRSINRRKHNRTIFKWSEKNEKNI